MVLEASSFSPLRPTSTSPKQLSEAKVIREWPHAWGVTQRPCCMGSLPAQEKCGKHWSVGLPSVASVYRVVTCWTDGTHSSKIKSHLTETLSRIFKQSAPLKRNTSSYMKQGNNHTSPYYYSSICLEWLTKDTENLGQDSWSPGQDVNTGTPLSTEQQC